MAAEFPDCELIGIDVSPIQPSTILPPNIQFELMNVLEGSYYRIDKYVVTYILR